MRCIGKIITAKGARDMADCAIRRRTGKATAQVASKVAGKRFTGRIGKDIDLRRRFGHKAGLGDDIGRIPDQRNALSGQFQKKRKMLHRGHSIQLLVT